MAALQPFGECHIALRGGALSRMVAERTRLHPINGFGLGLCGCFDRSWAPSVRHRRMAPPMSPSSQSPIMQETLIGPIGAAPAAPSTRSRAVVVLGVGRSGTSAITRGLVALGVEL